MRYLIFMLFLISMGVQATSPAIIKIKKIKEYSKEYYQVRANAMGNKYKIDRWKILYGIWMQESLLKHTAKGDKKNGKYHAFGLAQIQLHTAYIYTGKKYTIKQLMDVGANTDLSAHIFSDLLKRYKDAGEWQYVYAIAAYNSGTMPVDNAYNSDKLPPNYKKYVEKVIRYANSI